MKRYLMVILVVVTLGAPLFAQTTAQPTPPAAQDEFLPVTGTPANQETIPAARLVGLAYGFIWIVMFGYVWSVRSRLTKVERELDAVSRRVTSGSAGRK
jgi:CcmD family protein